MRGTAFAQDIKLGRSESVGSALGHSNGKRELEVEVAGGSHVGPGLSSEVDCDAASCCLVCETDGESKSVFNLPSSRARFRTPSAQVVHAFLSVVGRFARTASRRRSGESR